MTQITQVIATDDLVVHVCLAVLILSTALFLVSRLRVNRTAIFLLISAATTGTPAFADGQFGSDSDVLGFKLSMTQAEAKDYAIKNFPNSQLVMLPVTVNETGYTVNTVAGFILIDKENPKPGITEVVKIIFDPNKDSSDIIAISRVTDFIDAAKNGTSVLTKAAVESVKAKYGNPDIQKGLTDFVFIWGLKKNELKILFPTTGNSGLWYRTPGSYFGENTIRYQEDQAVSSASSASKVLASKLNDILYESSGRDIVIGDSMEHAGIMLQIDIWGGGDTVSAISQQLVDFTKGVDAFRAFRASIDAGIAAINKAKHDQISGNTYSP